MRVELMYEPGSSIRRVLDMLETAIAEERLPIAVELVETTGGSQMPVVRIDGQEIKHLIFSPAQGCSPNTFGTGISNYLDQFRDLLAEKWKELTKI